MLALWKEAIPFRFHCCQGLKRGENIMTIALERPTKKSRSAEIREQLRYAANLYHADIFRPYSDRLTPIATIPLNTPEEGIEELKYAVKELGLKAIQIPAYVTRVIPGFEKYSEEGYGN